MPSKQAKKDGFPTLPHCILNNPLWAGQWRTQLGVAPTAPLLLELACGKADFSIGWAQQRPDAAVIATDIKPNRLFDGAKRAQQLGINNLWFLREDILLLPNLFAPAEVDEIWITFPDPFPKARHARRRLTAPYYWQQYARVLKPTGWLHFKTDEPGLFRYSLQTLHQLGIQVDAQTDDLYASAYADTITGIETAYERLFRAAEKPIHYLRVQPQALLMQAT